MKLPFGNFLFVRKLPFGCNSRCLMKFLFDTEMRLSNISTFSNSQTPSWSNGLHSLDHYLVPHPIGEKFYNKWKVNFGGTFKY